MRFPAFIFLMLSCIAGTYSVRGIKRRAQLYRTLLILSAANLLLAFGISAFGRSSIPGVLLAAGFGVANAIVSVSLVTVLLPFFERITETTSNITLFEWSDLNLPLLKKLSVEAPGTYNHSIIVGNLAEAGAEAIGANCTLARVASYYHDIGKMVKPEYFIENQMGVKNPHAKLKPQLSCIILVSHVKEGNEIARQSRLPNAIVRIIREHHGTSLIIPFYEKAKKRAGNGKVDENQFRYPGPLPSSKESGIVMIADSVEAAARSIEEPGAKRLKSLIKEIIEERFRDGQLNGSQLTSFDLMKIGESFLPILVGMHHLRVEYP
jgi:putative nucleotidyltransferase with HDIG domain